MMLKNGHTYFHTARFLKYVWQLFNIMHERVNPLENVGLIETFITCSEAKESGQGRI